MRAQQINRVSATLLILLSLIALLTVLSGYTHPRQADEGAAAHIFQLSIVALVPMILLFLVTADWKQPRRSVRPLAIPAAALLLAFAALYYLEHFR
jgi:cytochrome bd-type quinol oxidase subunit 2